MNSNQTLYQRLAQYRKKLADTLRSVSDSNIIPDTSNTSNTPNPVPEVSVPCPECPNQEASNVVIYRDRIPFTQR